MAATVEFLQEATPSTADSASYTFAAQNLGAAVADRTIIASYHAIAIGEFPDFQVVSMTIGGVAAELQAQHARANGNTCAVGMLTATVPTGATGDVVVTFSDVCTACQVSLWRATGLNSNTARYTEGNIADPVSSKINCVEDGMIVAAASNDLANSTTWVGLSSEDYDGTVETMTFSGASETFSTAQTDIDVYPSFAVNLRDVSIICSFAPDTYSFPDKPNAFRVLESFEGKVGWTPDPRMQEILQINGSQIIGTSDRDPTTWDETYKPVTAGAATAGSLYFTNTELWPSMARNGGSPDSALRAEQYKPLLQSYFTGRQGDLTGDYSVLPEREYFSALEGEGGPEYELWQAANTNYLTEQIYQSQDWVFPSIYPFFKQEYNWRSYARENISEARRLAPGKPVYPFIRTLFHNTTFPTQKVPGPYMRDMLELCYDENCEGLVIWEPGRTFDPTETWWVQTNLFLDELTNKQPFITFPPPAVPTDPLGVTNLIVHADWKDRTSTFPQDLPNLPPYWTDISDSVNWEDETTFTDNGAYDTVHLDSDVTPGRPKCQVGIFPVKTGAEYTMYAYLTDYTHISGHDNGGMGDFRTGNRICPGSVSYTGPGWYAVGIVPTVDDIVVNIGLGFSNNQIGTLSFDRPGVVRGFIGPVTGDNDQHGPLTDEELFTSGVSITGTNVLYGPVDFLFGGR